MHVKKFSWCRKSSRRSRD